MEHKVESVMTAEVVTAKPMTPFRELVELLGRRRISALPVVDDAGTLLGIVSEADLLVKEGYPRGGDDAGVIESLRHWRRFDKAAGVQAADVMTRRVVTVPLGTEIATAARLMVRLGLRRLPVVDDRGRLAGIVTRGDLLKLFLRPDPAIAWEVRHELLEDRMGESATDLDVEVRDGVVSLTGKLDRRSQVRPLLDAVKGLDGVVGVDDHLAWRIDDLNRTAAWPIA
jgi:CBS-domain-containing membrane protein